MFWRRSHSNLEWLHMWSIQVLNVATPSGIRKSWMLWYFACVSARLRPREGWAVRGLGGLEFPTVRMDLVLAKLSSPWKHLTFATWKGRTSPGTISEYKAYVNHYNLLRLYTYYVVCLLRSKTIQNIHSEDFGILLERWYSRFECFVSLIIQVLNGAQSSPFRQYSWMEQYSRPSLLRISLYSVLKFNTISNVSFTFQFNTNSALCVLSRFYK